jgi:hypothetical protein
MSYANDGTPDNVSDPVTVGFGGWLQFEFLFLGRNLSGENRIYTVNQSGRLAVLIYPWRKMRRSRAPSIAPGTFFVAQSWADCITNMAGFNLRQAQPLLWSADQ